MKHKLFLTFIITIYATIINAQHLTVPDSTLAELHTKRIVLGENLKDTIIFKVTYPNNYDSTESYPVLLGLSGGNQSEKIVDYCYAAWFKSHYFKNYITILPISNKGENLLTASRADIIEMLAAIKSNFRTTNKNWIVVGTSNGGRASFNFVAEDPTLFQGGLVIPGTIANTMQVNKNWSHLKFVLAYGDQEEKDWIKGTKETKKVLSKHVRKVKTIVLKGQGHILPIEFNLDFVYQAFFEMSK